jgi:signal-transduction protein with cAMP-binding, CBS, and nucleotidyltransferase domain
LGKNNRIPGTVSALRPGQALTVKENMLVIESAQLMAAKRCDCVLVINDDDQLSGIFTVSFFFFFFLAVDRNQKLNFYFLLGKGYCIPIGC